MGKAIKIMRRSIHAFFAGYHSFASAATLLVFPVSASILLSQTLTHSSSPILQTLFSRIHSLFRAAGFPASSQFFSLLNLKISQTIFTFISTLPFTLTFLILAKAAVIRTLVKSPHTRLLPVLHLYRSILPAHLFNSLIVLSANAAIFSILFLAFNLLDVLHLSSSNSILALSAAAAVLYSVVLANTMVACSLATVVSAVENSGGCLSVLKACVLIRGKEATAVTLALPANLGMAAMEALFQYRIVRPYLRSKSFSLTIIGEAFSILYIYSLLIVFDTIVSYNLYRSCKPGQSLQPQVEGKGDLQA